MDDLGLNERHKKVMVLFRQELSVANSAYQEATGASRATAKRDLNNWSAKGCRRFLLHQDEKTAQGWFEWLIRSLIGK